MVSTILSSSNVSKLDYIKKCFLISILEWFLKDDTEDWSNDAENSALHQGINDIFKYIQIESSYFKL